MNLFSQWPPLDLTVLFNMLISAGIGLLAGFLGGWVGHLFSVQRDKQNRNWQELTYWRNVFEENLKEVQQIASVSGAIGFVYSDDAEHNIAIHSLREQYVMRQAQKARKRIVSLSEELGIDAGISRSDVRLQQIPPRIDS